MDWPEILSSATVAVLAVWLGATVLSRAPSNRAGRVFSILTMVLAAWAGAIAVRPFAMEAPAAAVIDQTRNAAAYLLPAVLLHLVGVFADARPTRIRVALVVAAYAVSLPLAARAFLDPARPMHVDSPHFTVPGIPGEVFGWSWIAVRMAILGVSALWAWRHLRVVGADASRRGQALAVLGTVGLGIAGGGLLILPSAVRPPLWIGIALVGLALVLATYAVIAQRVFLAPLVARRALSSTIAGGIAVALFIGLLASAEMLADRTLGIDLPIVTALALALSLALYDPGRLAWQRLVESWAARNAARRGVTFATAGHGLATQPAEMTVEPALSRLAWRLDLHGARATDADGAVIASVGAASDEPGGLHLRLIDGGEDLGSLHVGPKRSTLPFTAIETDLLGQAATYIAGSLRLAERDAAQAEERRALIEERSAHESRATALAAAVESREAGGLRVFALGPLRAEQDGKLVVQWGGAKAGSRQAEAVFAFLFDRGDRGVAKDELVDLIWPDIAVDRADVAFHRTLSGLRRTLDPARTTRSGRAEGAVVFYNDRYHLQPGVVAWSDTRAFEEAFVAASTADTLDGAIRALETARELYRGEYLDDCPFYGDSAEVEERRSRFRGRYVDLLVALGQRYEALGDRPSAAAAFREALGTSSEGCPPASDGLERLQAQP